MITALRNFLRRLVLTRDERELLADSPRRVFRARLLSKLLRWDQLAVVEALEDPARWQPDPAITKTEAEGWGAALLSQTGRKVDVAMTNLAQDVMAQAIQAAPGDIVRAAGYAAGFRASWESAKSISTIAGTDAGKPEEGADTASATLEHLRP